MSLLTSASAVLPAALATAFPSVTTAWTELVTSLSDEVDGSRSFSEATEFWRSSIAEQSCSLPAAWVVASLDSSSPPQAERAATVTRAATAARILMPRA